MRTKGEDDVATSGARGKDMEDQAEEEVEKTRSKSCSLQRKKPVKPARGWGIQLQ